jgi:1-deoxy-D-xylulose-5-phosphate synthase
LQRAYDQVIHDVALQNLPVIFCLDRSGLVGEDGATHHGVFDIAFLNCIPNLIIAAPKDEIELRNLMFTASKGMQHPIAIRYPRGRGENVNWQQPFEKIEIGKIKQLQKGTKVAILSTGTIGNTVTKALREIENSTLFSHYHFPFIKPLNNKEVLEIIDSHNCIITIEDGIITGGFGEQINSIMVRQNIQKPIKNLGIPDLFIEHGTVFELQQLCKIDVTHLVQLFNTLQHD